MFQISPSLSAGSLLNLGEMLEKTQTLKHIHLDIDDGNFVHGITFGMDTVKLVAEHSSVPLDVHLEVLNPLDYVKPLCEIGVAAVCAHVEALRFPSEFLSALKAGDCPKCGLALNLSTPPDVLSYYADQIDYALFVSVEADSDGLPFRPLTLEKVRVARELLPPHVELWVDGGINASNLGQVVQAGADGCVVGRAVFGADDPLVAATRLEELGETYRQGYHA